MADAGSFAPNIAIEMNKMEPGAIGKKADAFRSQVIRSLYDKQAKMDAKTPYMIETTVNKMKVWAIHHPDTKIKAEDEDERNGVQPKGRSGDLESEVEDPSPKEGNGKVKRSHTGSGPDTSISPEVSRAAKKRKLDHKTHIPIIWQDSAASLEKMARDARDYVEQGGQIPDPRAIDLDDLLEIARFRAYLEKASGQVIDYSKLVSGLYKWRSIPGNPDERKDIWTISPLSLAPKDDELQKSRQPPEIREQGHPAVKPPSQGNTIKQVIRSEGKYLDRIMATLRMSERVKAKILSWRLK
jgi:hypothetical protein